MNLFKTLIATVLLAFAVSGFAADVVDINSADAQTLEQLQGVGPAKAQAIVAYREANGPFATLEDLAKVQGIGLRTVEINREAMSVGGAPLAAKPGSGN
jgi:competence protein ComEA